MKKLLMCLIVALAFITSSCYIDEYVETYPSYPRSTVVVPPPAPGYYWTWPRYNTPYYSRPPYRPQYYHPAPPPPHNPPHHPGYNPPRPAPQPPHNPNNSGRSPRPTVTPRPSSGNPPAPRPNVSTSRQAPPTNHSTSTYKHR